MKQGRLKVMAMTFYLETPSYLLLRNGGKMTKLIFSIITIFYLFIQGNANQIIGGYNYPLITLHTSKYFFIEFRHLKKLIYVRNGWTITPVFPWRRHCL